MHFFLCDRYRFAEIRYHRPEETHKGRTVPAHVETVVLFLPDVWHCLPTRSEWEGLSRGLKEQLAEKLLAERKEADGEQALNANPSLLISASHRHRNRQTNTQIHKTNTGIIQNPLLLSHVYPSFFLKPIPSCFLYLLSQHCPCHHTPPHPASSHTHRNRLGHTLTSLLQLEKQILALPVHKLNEKLITFPCSVQIYVIFKFHSLLVECARCLFGNC